MLKIKEKVVNYNNKIQKAIEIFTMGIKLDNRKVFKEHFK